MSQIDTTRTWVPGDNVDAAKMNEIIDQAFAETALITGQTALATALDPAHDLVLVYDDSATALRKALVSALPSGVTTVGVTLTADISAVFGISVATPGTTPNISFTFDTQTRRTFLAAPVAAGGVPSFRAIDATDMVSVVVIAAYAIDFSLGNVFTKTLPDNLPHTFTFTADKGVPGQTYKVRLQRFGSGGGIGAISWNALGSPGLIRWPGGTVPVMTTGNSAVDVFEFLCVAANSYEGIRWGADLAV